MVSKVKILYRVISGEVMFTRAFKVDWYDCGISPMKCQSPMTCFQCFGLVNNDHPFVLSGTNGRMEGLCHDATLFVLLCCLPASGTHQCQTRESGQSGQVGTGVWLVYATFPRDNVLSTWLVWLRRERGTGWVGWFADKRDIPVPLDMMTQRQKSFAPSWNLMLLCVGQMSLPPSRIFERST